MDCILEDARWEKIGSGGSAPPGLEALAERAVQAALSYLGLPVTGFTLCVMGCDDARISVLNAEFRGKPVPTNVLSWPAEDRAAATSGQAPDLPVPGTADDPEPLGDIAIAYDTCLREAEAAGKSAQDHVTHLVVHGFLHLLGYDHVADADAALMERLETEILATLGVDDPY